MTLADPLRRKRYLSFSSVVGYTQNPGQWIFERDEANDSICYIKVDIPSPTFQQYLGCPNSDNSLGLYTTKGRFTRWSIQKIEGELLTIRYRGQKFNRDDVQLVIARDRGDNAQWVSAYKDIAVFYTGKKCMSFLTHITQQYSALKKRLFFLDCAALQTNNTVLYAIDNYERLTDVVPLGLNTTLNTTVTDFGLAYTVIQIMRDAGYSTGIGLNDTVARRLQADYRLKYKTTGGLNVLEYFLKMANLPIEGPAYNYTFGALVTVTKESIVQRPSDVYKRLLNIVTTEPADFIDTVIGRLWYHIMLNAKPISSTQTPSPPVVFTNRSTTPVSRSTTPIYRPPIANHQDISTNRATTPMYRPPIANHQDISANRATTPMYRPPIAIHQDISANRATTPMYRHLITTRPYQDISANRATTPKYRPPITNNLDISANRATTPKYRPPITNNLDISATTPTNYALIRPYTPRR